MKFDLEFLNEVSQKLHESCTANDWREGTYVYSIKFEPEEGLVEAHIQWPTFMELTRSSCPVSVQTMKGGPESLYLSCNIKGVRLVVCLFRVELERMLKELQVEDCLDELSASELLLKWQAITGWNKEVVE